MSWVRSCWRGLAFRRVISAPIRRATPHLLTMRFRAGLNESIGPETIGYLLDSGEVVFAGRRDDQIKVNGFRIKVVELHETVAGHPNVKQSYVTVSEGRTGERVVDAFVVPVDGEITTGELREYIRARLPAYMIPSTFCCNERLPLTASGKVDRQALLRLTQPAPRQPCRPRLR